VYPHPKEHELMTRSILCGLLALLSVGALGVLPVACQGGGVGDPCTPEDEFNTQFPGFKLALENIESRSFQCATRICLVNHFQGRVSCPAGQAAPKQCVQDGDCSAQAGAKCVQSQTYAPACNLCDPSDMNCMPTICPLGLTCSPSSQGSLAGLCTCAPGSTLPAVNGIKFACEAADPSCTDPKVGCFYVLRSYVCHIPSVPGKTQSCQQTGDNAKDPAVEARACCVPGTDTPVTVAVCGECETGSNRDADQAVYCSCRCCAPCCMPNTSDTDAIAQGCSNDVSTCGPACDPNFNYCSCPSGYSCTTIRTDVGLGDKQLAGAYCIKAGSAYQATISEGKCGMVAGHWEMGCDGLPGAAVTTGDGG
jgi:hypothetical protein